MRTYILNYYSCFHSEAPVPGPLASFLSVPGEMMITIKRDSIEKKRLIVLACKSYQIFVVCSPTIAIVCSLLPVFCCFSLAYIVPSHGPLIHNLQIQGESSEAIGG